MKRLLKSLTGFTISGSDGEIGKVKEFYFDDHTWTIRYLIVETGSWFFGRKVLLSTRSIKSTDWEQKHFNVDLTTEQIKNSPDIDTDKPVSRQHEIDLHSHYPWGGYYWGNDVGPTGLNIISPLHLSEALKPEEDLSVFEKSNHDPHLRSTSKVTNYSVKAADGNIGSLEDFIITDNDWKIYYILVDTGHLFPGKKVLISPKWIKEISWEKSTVLINASELQVRNSPEFDPATFTDDSYDKSLQNYYGRFISHKK